MHALTTQLKREYWEHKSAALHIPVGFAMFLILLATVALLLVNIHEDKITGIQNSSPPENAIEHDAALAAKPAEETASVLPLPNRAHPHENLNMHVDGHFGVDDSRSAPAITNVFLFIAWLVAFNYLSGCLLSDRKDQSVLFWKSLPVSDSTTVLSKLSFGVIVIPTMAAAVSVLCYLILLVFGLSAMLTVDGLLEASGDWHGFDLLEMLLYPMLAVVAGALWGAPLFAFLAACSACAKRSAFLLFIAPIGLLAIAEGILFGSGHFLRWLADHTPFAVMDDIYYYDGIQGFLLNTFVYQAGEWLPGVILAAVFIALAIWARKWRFEI